MMNTVIEAHNAFPAKSGLLPQLACKDSHFSDQCSVRRYFFFRWFIAYSFPQK